MVEALEHRVTLTGDLGYALNLGGTSFDRGTAVVSDSAGNSYVAGLFTGTADFDPGPATANLTAAGTAPATDAFVAKYDTAGHLVWVKQFGGTNWDQAAGMAIDSSGNLFVTGYTTTSGGITNVFVNKLDSAGNLVWSKQMGGPSGAQGSGIAVDASGNIYLTGWFGGTVNLNPAGSPADNHTAAGGNPNIFIEKLDSSGNDLWSRAFGNASGENGVAIAVDSTGNVYSTGLYRGTVDFDPGTGVANLVSQASDCEVYVLKLDGNGNFLWAKSLGSQGTNEGQGIAVEAAGSVYTTGLFQSTGDFDPGVGTVNLTSAGSFDAFLSKLDSGGNFVWVKGMGSTSGDQGNAVSVVGTDLYLTGQFQGLVNFDPGGGNTSLTSAGMDGFVARYTTNGALAWVRQFGGANGYVAPMAIGIGPQGNVFTTGQFEGSNIDFDPGPAAFNLSTSSANDLNVYVSKLTQNAGVFTATDVSDGFAQDTNGTGQYTTLDTTGSAIKADAMDRDRGLIEFSLAGLDPSATIISASLTGAPQLLQYGSPNNGVGINFYAYQGDGAVSLADATAAASFAGSLSTSSLSTFAVPLNPASLQPLVGQSGFIGIQVRQTIGERFWLSSKEGFNPNLTPTLVITYTLNKPVAQNDAYGVTENSVLTVSGPGVLSNDINPSGNPVTASVVANPAHGSLTFGADGSFTYTPAANFFGSDSFTYKFNDGQQDSNTATVSLTVSQPNVAPVAVNDSYSVNENSLITIGAPGVLVNDTDANADPLTAFTVTGPAHGVLSLSPNGSFTYTPSTNYFGPDSFTYKASDGQLSSNTATVSITVNHVNQPPASLNDTYGVTKNTALSVPAAGVLANDTDPDGDALTAIFISGPSHGTLTLNSNGSFTYTPAANYLGSDTFRYKANDGLLDGNTATVTLNVTGPDDAPVATADSYTVAEDGSIHPQPPGVLGNDTDPNGQPLTAVLVTGPAHGTLSLLASGDFTYTPTALYRGPDSFTYKASDGTLSSNTVTVSITVTPVNHAPVAVADNFTTAEDQPLNVAAPGLMSNDSDPDGDPIQAFLLQVPNNGTITINKDGSFTYTPRLHFHGTDSFQYYVFDGQTTSNVVNDTINVTFVNYPPVANNDVYRVPLNGSLTTAAAQTSLVLNSQTGDYIGGGVNRSFSATDGTYSPVHGPANTVVIYFNAFVGGENWTLSFAAPNGALLTAGTYLNATRYPFEDPSVPGLDISGDGRGSNTLTGQFTVLQAVYDSSGNVVSFDATFVQHSEGATPALTGEVKYQATGGVPGGVLFNDTDVENEPLSASLVSGPTHGALSLQADGSFVYTPVANYSGPDSFTYKASDAGGTSNVATVALNVDQPPTLAVIADQSMAANPATLNVTLTGADADNDPLTYSAQAQTLPFWLKQTYGLYQDSGGYYLSFRGQQEKYLRGTKSANGYTDPAGYWYYILPSGDLYEFKPPYSNSALTGTLVARLGTSFYTDPSLLWNAQNTAVPVTLSFAANVLTIAPSAGFSGTFVAIAAANDGMGGAASRSFKVTVGQQANRPPTLAPVVDQTVGANPATITVTLNGSDPDSDPLTYSAQAQTLPFWLKQTFGMFQDPGGYYLNYRGQQEKYLRGTKSASGYNDPGGYWYYILPNGDLYEFTPPYTNGALVGALVAHMGTSVYANPALITGATNTAVAVTLTATGNQLQIAPGSGLTGTFVVIASVSDGRGGSASQAFKVTVSQSAQQPPTLAAVADQSMGQNPATLNVTLNGSDPNNDPLTYSAQAQTLPFWLKQTFGMYQDPGGYYLNYRGQQEKYLRGTKSASGYSDPAGYWYYIMPNGDLFEFTPPYSNAKLVGALVAHLSTAIYNDPSLLWNAANTAVPVGLTINGNILTIAPNAGFTGGFVIIASVTDGQSSASRAFKVTVA